MLPAGVAHRTAGRRRAGDAARSCSTDPDYLAAARRGRAAGVPAGDGRRRGRHSCRWISGSSKRPDGIEGRLVELQAFPSLYGFQLMLGGDVPRAVRPAGADAVHRRPRSRRRTSRSVGAPSSARTIRPRSCCSRSTRSIRRRGRISWRPSSSGACAPSICRRVVREGRRLFCARDGRLDADRADLQPRHPRRARCGTGARAAVRLTAPISTSNGSAVRTGSSGSASSRFPGFEHPWVPTTYLPARECRSLPGQSRRLAAEAAVLVRRRRHHLRADRCGHRRDSGEPSGRHYILQERDAVHAGDRDAARRDAGRDPDHDGPRRRRLSRASCRCAAWAAAR